MPLLDERMTLFEHRVYVRSPERESIRENRVWLSPNYITMRDIGAIQQISPVNR